MTALDCFITVLATITFLIFAVLIVLYSISEAANTLFI